MQSEVISLTRFHHGGYRESQIYAEGYDEEPFVVIPIPSRGLFIGVAGVHGPKHARCRYNHSHTATTCFS